MPIIRLLGLLLPLLLLLLRLLPLILYYDYSCYLWQLMP